MMKEKEVRKREPLNSLAVKAAQPRDEDQKLSDTGGLHFFVSTVQSQEVALQVSLGGKGRRLF